MVFGNRTFTFSALEGTCGVVVLGVSSEGMGGIRAGIARGIAVRIAAPGTVSSMHLMKSSRGIVGPSEGWNSCRFALYIFHETPEMDETMRQRLVRSFY